MYVVGSLQCSCIKHRQTPIRLPFLVSHLLPILFYEDSVLWPLLCMLHIDTAGLHVDL